MKKLLKIPKELVPKGFENSKYQGVFLIFVNGESKKQIDKKVEQIKKITEMISIT